MNTDRARGGLAIWGSRSWREILRQAFVRLDEANPDHLNDLAHRIIGAAYSVSNELGPGFLEKVYENALAIEIASIGIPVERQRPIPVLYKEQVVGEYFADLLVDQQIIVELKCVTAFSPEHTAQCINYLHATNLQLCLLINFQHAKVQIKRIAY